MMPSWRSEALKAVPADSPLTWDTNEFGEKVKSWECKAVALGGAFSFFSFSSSSFSYLLHLRHRARPGCQTRHPPLDSPAPRSSWSHLKKKKKKENPQTLQKQKKKKKKRKKKKEKTERSPCKKEKKEIKAETEIEAETEGNRKRIAENSRE